MDQADTVEFSVFLWLGIFHSLFLCETDNNEIRRHSVSFQPPDTRLCVTDYSEMEAADRPALLVVQHDENNIFRSTRDKNHI
jgi:hypothetical protein